MPLDVQPLSPTRRALMLGVLLALLGASVGFAQILVLTRHAAPKIAWNLPPDLKRVELTENDPREVEIRAVGLIAGQPRWVQGLVVDVPRRTSRDQQMVLLQSLFLDLLDAEPYAARPGTLGGRVGLELEGRNDQGLFGIVRLAVFQDKAVAICYSGIGAVTDWDRLYFNHVCQRVTLGAEQPPRKRK